MGRKRADDAWNNPMGDRKLTDAEEHCTPGLTAFIDSLSRAQPPSVRPQYAPPPTPPPSEETMRQGQLAFAPQVTDYRCPPRPAFLDAQLLLPLQRGFIARPYLNSIDHKLELFDERTNAEPDARKKLTLIREARDYLWRERCFFHGLETMIERKKPAFDPALPEVKKAMYEVDTISPLYRAADESYVKHIRAGKLK
jgi:hypothetical protein